jgi:hypothetical protein
MSEAVSADEAFEPYVDVTQFGAVGDGVTDDTAAIQAALDAGGGKIVFFPAGTYMVNANLTNHIGLRVTKPWTRLVLDPAATLKVIPNGSDNYALLQITAADCSLESGTFQGDVSTHTGTTGEWGHLLVIDTGADRFLAQRTLFRDAWGDGVVIQRGPADVQVISCTADNNRRQGMSITGAVRPRVFGGVYKNTGATKYTLPCAGIDIEPNPGSGYDVVDAMVTGVHFEGNRGEGLLAIRAAGVGTEALVANCTATGNGVGSTASGFRAGGTGAGLLRVLFSGCRSSANTGHGFDLFAVGSEATGCEASKNTQNGFDMSGAGTVLTAPSAHSNGGHGIHFAGGAGTGSAMMVGGASWANSQQASNVSSNVSVDAAVNSTLRKLLPGRRSISRSRDQLSSNCASGRWDHRVTDSASGAGVSASKRRSRCPVLFQAAGSRLVESRRRIVIAAGRSCSPS